jgi:hypothetical protein
VCLYDARSGKVTLLSSINRPFGTGTGQRDEQTVAWSPTGKSILIVDTHARPSVYILGVDGRDQVRPRHGTFARWLDREAILFQAEPKTIDQAWRWVSLRLSSDRMDRMDLPKNTFRAAVSQDGTMIVFDDGDVDEPTTFLLDLRSGATQRLIRGYAAPIWLSLNEVAVTEAQPCPSQSECGDWWSEAGKTVAVDVEDGSERGLTLPTTLQQARIFSTIDVFASE